MAGRDRLIALSAPKNGTRVTENKQVSIAFYGDDITGSTDAMEALVLAGVPTVLFLEPPAPGLVREQFPHIMAVGLAGMSRTMTPGEMDAVLPQVFASLKALGAPLTHYKVCSTFDSSPEVGSIGRALDIGFEIFKPDYVPVAVGAPKLKRFVVFGNLFATIDGETYRIDRHPVMSKHPVTPMHESDLRRHLGRQTAKRIDLLDVRRLEGPDSAVDQSIQEMLEDGVEVVILDTLDETHLLKVGRLLTDVGKSLGHRVDQRRQSFVVGSSGVEFALTAFWQAEGKIQPPQSFEPPGPVEQVVAVSGSASPWTAAQIQWAIKNGFQGLHLAGERLVDPAAQEVERTAVIDEAVRLIDEGKSVLLYLALGPDDPQIQATREKAGSLGLSSGESGEVLGRQLGLVLKEILKKTGLKRTAVAGGDTCGHVLKQLAIYVLEFIIPLGLAAPLCKASSHDPAFDKLEIALKGGQLGDIDFFGSLRSGGDLTENGKRAGGGVATRQSGKMQDTGPIIDPGPLD